VVAAGNPLNFSSIVSGAGGVGSTSGTASRFVLQPGLYQIQFFANAVISCNNALDVDLNATTLVVEWFPVTFNTQCPLTGTMSEYQLLQVSSPNQTLEFVASSFSQNVNFSQGATLILTQLQ
jgi:hypothetical protein